MLRIILHGKISRYYCSSSKTSVIELCVQDGKETETDVAGLEVHMSFGQSNYFRIFFYFLVAPSVRAEQLICSLWRVSVWLVGCLYLPPSPEREKYLTPDLA